MGRSEAAFGRSAGYRVLFVASVGVGESGLERHSVAMITNRAAALKAKKTMSIALRTYGDESK